MIAMSAEVLAFLQQPHFAVAATLAPDGLPHQTVVWYMLDGADVVFSIPENSVKHKHLLRDARVSLCIEEAFRYVTLAGRAELSADPGRQIYQQLGARYQPVIALRAAAPAMPDSRVADLMTRERVTIRVKIDKLVTMGMA